MSKAIPKEKRPIGDMGLGAKGLLARVQAASMRPQQFDKWPELLAKAEVASGANRWN